MRGPEDMTTPVVIAESPDEIYLAADCGYWTLGERALTRCALDDLERAAENSLDDENLTYTRFTAVETDPAKSVARELHGAQIIAELSADGTITLQTYRMSEAARAYFRMQS